jgi:hypothetical protein
VHPNQVVAWKKQALADRPPLFAERRACIARDEETRSARICPQIGQLEVALDWLTKKVGLLG